MTREQSLEKPWQMQVLEGCIDGIACIKEEKERLEVCQALFNLIVHGGFCNDKQALVPLQDAEDPNYFNLVKAEDAKKIADLRGSMGRRLC